MVPSTWAEPKGLVAVELLAAGLIPVVAAHGGLAENVGKIGCSFPNGDAAALAARLEHLLRGTPQSFPLSEVQSLVVPFRPERIAARYEALYAAVIR